MDKLENARNEINRADAEMRKLFLARMVAAKEIAEYKKEHGLPVLDSAREEEVIRRNCERLEAKEMEPYYREFLKNTMAVSRAYQNEQMRTMRVAYCGTEGAFAALAAKKLFPLAGALAYPTFEEAYRATESGEADAAVLPLENSTAGEVGTVADLIFSGNLYLNEVLDVAVTHDLLTLPGVRKEDIRTVISHPQALSQCAEYLKKLGVETRAFSNTALAAEYVKKQNDRSLAAVASAESAALFGLSVLESGINDRGDNTTRFGAFSRRKNTPEGTGKREDENFLLVFTVRNESGSLAGALNIIGAHGFNLRSLRSRPMQGLRWNYYFTVEAEGNINTAEGQDMLHELSAICAKLRLVGSYYADNVR